jgi:predicted nuclease of predicted toxin-antitoxin system
MRILIDECLDERLRGSFSGHDCQTARYAGFAGLKNGELLSAAESARFEVLLTADQGLEYEQNLTGRKIAVIIFHAKSIRLKDLLPHIPACVALLPSIKPGETVRIPDNQR